ncbi:hypothetical protein FA13DRAFT_1723978 [Coprinellus micaceus]|uniref:AN1-type domain-containing protein n=1 Tax=Coprinellus micaceus TaxID=71717 RepID=A0A4Y7U141_COPMI|nr:hypothetical protein FA13DRAFT_1723978 [Coprinellus micaceus]
MSGPSLSNLVDNGQMLLLGTQCAEATCMQVDFLPFKCPHCNKSYCQTHYKAEDHKCPEYEEFLHNRIAPNCPFCNIPVAVPPSQDPNVRMELHFEKECSVILGEVPPRPTPRCSKSVCNKVLFSPIPCPSCKEVHCVAHRFPVEHSCSKAAFASTKAQASVGVFVKTFNAKASVFAADFKKTVVSAAASASTLSAEAAKAASTSTTNAIDKLQTGRRAKSERKSQLRGMRERNERGLLSEEETVILGRLEAGNNFNKNKEDCLIM